MGEPSPNAEADSRGASPLVMLLFSRAGLFIFAYLGLSLVPAGSNPGGNAFPGNHFLDGWTRWDAGWYARIAREGYSNTALDESGQRDAGNLPLYPLAIRGLSKLLGGDVYLAGLIIANASFVVAGLLLHALAAARWGAEVARRALVLLCVYPFSYTFSAMYTESLFLLCAVATFWFGERRWWFTAAVCAAAAGATRVVGVACGIALVLMYLRDVARWRARNLLRWDALSLPLAFAGLAAFVLYLWIRFDEPLAFVAVHGDAAGWADSNSWQSVVETMRSWQAARFGSIASGNVPLLLTMHLLMIAIALVLSLIAWRKLPAAYAAFATVVVVISMYRWVAFGRHFATVFPAFVVAAMLLRDRRLYHGIVYISTLLLALFTFMFTHAYWVA